MKIPSKLLLRLLLAYGLMNREAFEEKITHLLSGYMDDPDDLNKMYEFLFTQMDELKDYLSLENLARASGQATNDELKSEIRDLRKAIEQLSEKIDRKQEDVK